MRRCRGIIRCRREGDAALDLVDAKEKGIRRGFICVEVNDEHLGHDSDVDKQIQLFGASNLEEDMEEARVVHI